MQPVRRFRVHGRVQGVGFRAFVWRTAASLDVDGWVRNRLDGSVEVLARAPEAALGELLVRLEEGPRLSRVDRVEVTEEATDHEVAAGFAVRHDG